MTIQISVHFPCDWVSVPERRVLKCLGLLDPSDCSPITPNGAPLYSVHIALHIDHEADTVIFRQYWTNLDLNVYQKPKYVVPLVNDVAKIKTECNNSERSSRKSGRTTNEECCFIFLLLMLLLGSVGGSFHEKEISDKQDWKSWGGGECIVSSY